MLGYYKNEEETARVMDSDGYFHTGDIGLKDSDSGYIFITGRSKNLIILSNGKNIYPEEIEYELADIPGVCDVVVYEGQSSCGVMNNKIVAEFYMLPGYAEEQNIKDVKKYISGYVEKYNRSAVSYKRIGFVRIRQKEFPKNTLRKIVRYKIDRTIE